MTQREEMLAVAVIERAGGEPLEYTDTLKGLVPGGRITRDDLRALADKAVRHHNLTTPWKDPQAVIVRIYKVVPKDGLLTRVDAFQAIDVMPPTTRMTDAEYQEELADVLKLLSPEFHPFVREKSWDDGHSAGYEEVLLIARNLAIGLAPCIADFETRVVTTARKRK